MTGKTNAAETSILKKIYSVGALYFNTTDINPAEIFGFGTWVRVAQNMALWGASANGQGGTTKAAGLPNITSGQFGACMWGDNGNYPGGGAVVKDYTPNAKSGGGNKNVQESAYHFDASQSNPIYGASMTVQPPAYVVNVWRRTA